MARAVSAALGERPEAAVLGEASEARSTLCRVVIGRDTRLSGHFLEQAMAAGFSASGVEVFCVGVVPTPAVAFLTKTLRADLGVVLSASHNSSGDNGIKFFNGAGRKLDDATEFAIERAYFQLEAQGVGMPSGSGSVHEGCVSVGRVHMVEDALGRYVEGVKRSVPEGFDLKGMRIAVDCAQGAASKSTPQLLRELGAEVVVGFDRPDGSNINADCGSTYPEAIQRLVRDSGAVLGISHDGDADRVLLCDHMGELVDGDEMLAIAAIALLQEDRLPQRTVVATVMGSFGLEEALAPYGGRVVRAAVGDRYVIEEMQRGGFALGGEQSGHMIFGEYTTTGDGALSALQILRVLRESDQSLQELKTCLRKYPQVLRNLPVREKPPLEELASVSTVVDAVTHSLNGKGRVLLRYSGTEPKVRVLVEGRDAGEIAGHAEQIAKALIEAIG